MTHQKFRIWLLAITFSVAISLPLLNDTFGFWADLPSKEQRKLAEKPSLDITYLDGFPKDYDRYYADHFTWRSRFVSLYQNIHLKGFGISPFPDHAILGKDNWYFANGFDQQAYESDPTWKPWELEAFAKELNFRQAFLKEQGSTMYFMPIPSKNTIYAEKMPATSFRQGKSSWGEQLIAYLQANTSINVIDLFPRFKEMHTRQELYYKYDTHWNGRGAFMAAQAVLSAVHKDFPDVNTAKENDYDVESGFRNLSNLVGMLGGGAEIQDSTFNFKPKTGIKAVEAPKVPYPIVYGFPYPELFEVAKSNPNGNQRRLLFICDSFGHDFLPIIAEYFGRTVHIFDSWQYKLNENIAIQEKADVVLFMVIEGNLRSMAQFPAIAATLNDSISN